MQLFDDLEDFGAFDDVVSGDVRDPHPELARLRRVEQMLRDNETFPSVIIIDAFVASGVARSDGLGAPSQSTATQ
jgi:hypothetical protein